MESRALRVQISQVRLLLLLLLCFPVSFGSLGDWISVFLNKPHASQVLLQRSRRANSMFEELKDGNLERECLEERCSYEEAREIFSVPEHLKDFWERYSDGDQCEPKPCLNGATCVDQLNAYICICPIGFEGRNCDKVTLLADNNGCLFRNGGCEHFCMETISSHVCSCATGYSLGADNSSCIPQMPFPCGKTVATAFSPRIVKGEVCPRGQCPWQALLKLDRTYKCGAIVLDTKWILTAGHCVWGMEPPRLEVVVGEHNRNVDEGSEQVRKVTKILVHKHYNSTSKDNDLALLQLDSPITLGPYVIPVCLPPKMGTFSRTMAAIRLSTVSGWGKMAQSGPASIVLQRVEVPRVPLQECRPDTGLQLTNNMLCAGFKEGGRDSCQGDSGGPLVTRYKNTNFLLGIVSWGKGCAATDSYGIYTRVANYIEWLESTMMTA